MYLGFAMEEYQGLQTHLNLRRDFTGSFAKMEEYQLWCHLKIK